MSTFKLDIIKQVLTKATSPTKYPIKSVEGRDRDILYEYVANKILARSQELVPVDTGNLLNSGRVVRNSIGTFSVVYFCDYAVYVHEIMENLHDPPGQAKFLEDAAFDVLGEFGYYIPFTFSMDTGYNDLLALHLDSIDFNTFIKYISRINKFSMPPSIFGDIETTSQLFDSYDLDNPIEVKEAISYDFT